jgi:GNAT superfamily N-acetyltransferase
MPLHHHAPPRGGDRDHRAPVDAAWSVSRDPARLQLDVVHGWLASAYWSPDVRRDVLERAFANSLVAGAYDARGAQIGVARAVTDQATFAWLCDVFVAEDWRGRGIARAMVRALMADERLATLRRWCLATRDAHDVYRPLGFEPVDAARWMERRLDPAAWREGSR